MTVDVSGESLEALELLERKATRDVSTSEIVRQAIVEKAARELGVGS